jgi:hypothetical protein
MENSFRKPGNRREENGKYGNRKKPSGERHKTKRVKTFFKS